MNLSDAKAQGFALVREMLEAPDVAAGMDWKAAARLGAGARERGSVLFTGEGSSRIFPANNAIALARRRGAPGRFFTEGARQAAGYPLGESLVLGASNSGRTRELVELFQALRDSGHADLRALTATPGGPVEALAHETIVLRCGPEQAVAATKSVIEQALFCQIMEEETFETCDWSAPLSGLGARLREVLTAPLDAALVAPLAAASTLYVAGRRDGVAEELALKACEIARKRSLYCEGTHILHGVEETMSPRDAVLLIEPFESEWDMMQQRLQMGVGLFVAAIASKPTPFPTIRIPRLPDFDGFLQLAAGWSLLAAMGLLEGIDLDRTERARKVGNEARNA